MFCKKIDIALNITKPQPIFSSMLLKEIRNREVELEILNFHLEKTLEKLKVLEINFSNFIKKCTKGEKFCSGFGKILGNLFSILLIADRKQINTIREKRVQLTLVQKEISDRNSIIGQRQQQLFQRIYHKLIEIDDGDPADTFAKIEKVKIIIDRHLQLISDCREALGYAFTDECFDAISDSFIITLISFFSNNSASLKLNKLKAHHQIFVDTIQSFQTEIKMLPPKSLDFFTNALDLIFDFSILDIYSLISLWKISSKITELEKYQQQIITIANQFNEIYFKARQEVINYIEEIRIGLAN